VEESGCRRIGSTLREVERLERFRGMPRAEPRKGGEVERGALLRRLGGGRRQRISSLVIALRERRLRGLQGARWCRCRRGERED